MDWFKRVVLGFAVATATSAFASTEPPGVSHTIRQPTPAEAAVLKKISAVDAEPDQLARCLHYPDPLDVHWNKASVAVLCHMQFDPVPTLAELRQKLDKEGPAALDRYFDGLRKAQAKPETAWQLDLVTDRVFSCGCTELRDFSDAWLARSPDDPWALLVSGMYYAEAAQKARGDLAARETDEARLARMRVLDDKARVPLAKALDKDPGMTPAITEMLWIEARGGSPDVLQHINAALDAFPGNYNVHEVASELLQPKWYGSDALADQEEQRALAASATYPVLHQLLTNMEWDRSTCGSDCSPPLAVLNKVNETGPMIPALRGLIREHGMSSDFVGSVIYATQVLRFSRHPDPHVRTGRGIDRQMLHDLDGAQADAELALSQDPGDERAMMLMQSIELIRKGPRAGPDGPTR